MIQLLNVKKSRKYYIGKGLKNMNFKKNIVQFLLIVTGIFSCPVVKADIYTKNQIPKNIAKQIQKIVEQPSNLNGVANFKRKSKLQRIKDNIAWYKNHGKVNTLYNVYGLDIKNFRNQDGYITGKELKQLAVHHGNVDPLKYKDLLDDKLLFDQRVREHFPEALADIYFEFKGQNIIPRKNAKLQDYDDTLSALRSLDNGKYFIKELDGLGGNNAILLTKQNNDLKFRHVTKGEISLEDFLTITQKRSFVVQKHIENHSDIKKLSPAALSTIRIVSTRFNKDVHILSCDLRVSCSENSVVDNFAKGGALIHVNEKTGKLDEYAFRKHKKIMDKHPVSGIKFKNYQLPFWNESIKLVKKLHEIFPEFSSIGWDVAITENGPMIIEGNYGWGYYGTQITAGGMKEKWEKLHKI